MRLCAPSALRARWGLDAPTRDGVLISDQYQAEHDGPQVLYLEQLPAPRAELLSGWLAADQVWCAPALLQELEARGVPAHRLRACAGPQEFELRAAELEALLEARSGQRAVWRGPFGRHSSLAGVNSCLAAALEADGWQLELQATAAAASVQTVPAVSQSWPPQLLPASRGPLALLAPWEYWHLPRSWAVAAPRVADRLWLPSAYAREGAIASGVNPDWVQVVPCGVDLELYRPGPGLPLGRPGETVFLFVGGTVRRKGIDLLQDAWERAFAAEDPVRLVIKDFGATGAYREHSSAEQLRTWAAAPDHAPVSFLDRHLPPEEMPELYRGADVAVFPYRAEGFCMPALEAMACGVPVILPDRGPTSEFCRQGGWKVPTERREILPPEGMETVGPPIVHQVDVEALAQALQRAAGDAQERERRAAQACREAQQWSWSAAAARAGSFLQELAEEPRAPVHTLQPRRPEARRHLLAARPDWEQANWQQTLPQALQRLAGQTEVTVALWLGDGDEQYALERLLSALTDAGMDPEALQLDLTLVSGQEWRELALAADLVLELGVADAGLGTPACTSAALPDALTRRR